MFLGWKTVEKEVGALGQLLYSLVLCFNNFPDPSFSEASDSSRVGGGGGRRSKRLVRSSLDGAIIGCPSIPEPGRSMGIFWLFKKPITENLPWGSHHPDGSNSLWADASSLPQTLGTQVLDDGICPHSWAALSIYMSFSHPKESHSGSWETLQEMLGPHPAGFPSFYPSSALPSTFHGLESDLNCGEHISNNLG